MTDTKAVQAAIERVREWAKAEQAFGAFRSGAGEPELADDLIAICDYAAARTGGEDG